MTADIRTRAVSPPRPPFTIDAFGRGLRRYAIFIILAALVAFFSHAEPAFLRVNNLSSVLQSVAASRCSRSASRSPSQWMALISR